MLKSIDLFAGAGGLSEGLKRAGFQSLYSNEISMRYAQTYRCNHPATQVDSRDIREVSAVDVRRRLGVAIGELDLIAGGPPCQGFSINAPKRSSDDRRNHLFREYLRFVEEFQPRVVMIENVPGMVSYEGGATLEAILRSLEVLGYSADVRILYAPHFGVPQMRWRTIIIGARNGVEPSGMFPTPMHRAPVRVNFTSQFAGRNIVALHDSMELPSHVTVRDAIDDLPVLGNGEIGHAFKPYRTAPQNAYQVLMREDSDAVSCHEAARLGQINLQRLAHIPPGGNWTNIPEAMLPKGMRRARRSDHTKRYGRVDPEGLASTILTKCDPHWGAYFHYSQERVFTVREAARLQSFPDTYVFCGSRGEQYEQVGNAVPPLLAAAVGCSIRQALNGAAAVTAPAQVRRV